MSRLAKHQRLRRRFRANEAGAAAVEFAFVIPVLLIGLFLTVEFARVMYSKIEFEYAVFSATRLSGISKSADTAKVTQALGDSLILLNPAHLSPLGMTVVNNPDKTQTVTLSAAYRVDALLPMVSFSSVTLKRTVSYLIAQ